MKRLLLDADALIAIAKEDDTNHKKATAVAQKIKDLTLYITPFTIPESVTVISYRVGQKEAKAFLKEARTKKLIELPLTKDIIDEADEIFLSQNKKGTSWADCLNCATIKLHQLDAIFSFDRFYKQMRIPVLK